MEINWIQVLASVIIALISSTGLWSFLATRREKTDASKQMLIGLAHDRIISLGTAYVERGYITADEFENLYNYLYVPYEKLGGNGSARRVMDAVQRLPLHN